MRINEIAKLFKSENTLDKVIEQHKDDFNKIDYWANLLRDGMVDNPAEMEQALREVTGAFSNLRITLAVAETEKRNRQVRFKNKIRIDTEEAGKKYVDTKAETEAVAYVADYRRIRNWIEGYKESAEKIISVLQNINNNLDKELRKNPQG